MELRFCIQDPTNTETTYLYEAILTAAIEADRWRGMYAFATRDGVDHLIEDDIVRDFLRAGGEIDLLVGIDAVTNRPTLEHLRELEHRNHLFRPKVFWNATAGLFHPKVSHFSYADGRRRLIVGSGNLTPGGLVNNFEAYTLITVDRAEELDVSALDEFLARHAPDIRSIDEGALERASRNLVRPIEKVRQAGRIIVPRRRRPLPGVVGFDRILIAQVPGAGGRWKQAHLNFDVVRDYFRITDLRTQRVYLTEVTADGLRSEVEVRRCIYSQRNKNYKIEIRAARGKDYPDGAPPILVLRERQLRTFDYTLLMPGEEGYDSLVKLLLRLPKVGRGMVRAIADLDTLADAWADCPLLEPWNTDQKGDLSRAL